LETLLRARAAGKDVESIVVGDESVDGMAKLCRSLSDIRSVRFDQGIEEGAA